MDSLIDLDKLEEIIQRGDLPTDVKGYRPTIVVPAGCQVTLMSPIWDQPLPDHVRQTVTFRSRQSFSDYINRFKNLSTQVFVHSISVGAQCLAVIDYHDSTGSPSRTTHRADYLPAYSKEFKAWMDINRKPISQEAFLAHLRSWGYTIVSHTDADLIEIASSLEFSSKGVFSSKVERVTGGRMLTFNEEVEGSAQSRGSKIAVPERISISAPVFERAEEAVTYVADLLYRPANGALTITVELHQIHRVIDAAIEEMIAMITAETKIKPYFGFPVGFVPND